MYTYVKRGRWESGRNWSGKTNANRLIWENFSFSQYAEREPLQIPFNKQYFRLMGMVEVQH